MKKVSRLSEDEYDDIQGHLIAEGLINMLYDDLTDGNDIWLLWEN